MNFLWTCVLRAIARFRYSVAAASLPRFSSSSAAKSSASNWSSVLPHCAANRIGSLTSPTPVPMFPRFRPSVLASPTSASASRPGSFAFFASSRGAEHPERRIAMGLDRLRRSHVDLVRPCRDAESIDGSNVFKAAKLDLAERCPREISLRHKRFIACLQFPFRVFQLRTQGIALARPVEVLPVLFDPLHPLFLQLLRLVPGHRQSHGKNQAAEEGWLLLRPNPIAAPLLSLER